MKRFAIYFNKSDNPLIVEGVSADIKRKSDGLKVTIQTGPKTKQNFTGVVLFCEVSERINVR